MRKLIVACLLFGFLAAGNASMIVQEPAVPGPSNPYCNKTVTDFTAPDIVCPDDGYYVVDTSCVEPCRETYKTKMLAIYDAACTKYDNADHNYRTCFRAALDVYRVCDGGAQTAAQIQACRNNLMSSVTTCTNTLNSTRAGIAANVDVDINAAKSAFQTCASACCRKIGDLDKQNNDGKIGRQDTNNATSK